LSSNGVEFVIGYEDISWPIEEEES
jgi:hypothetical protein